MTTPAQPEGELPGMLQLSANVAAQKWPHTMDAQVWAREFINHVKQHPHIVTDDGTMLVWFANAIMAGYDTAGQKLAAVTKQRDEALDRWKAAAVSTQQHFTAAIREREETKVKLERAEALLSEWKDACGLYRNGLACCDPDWSARLDKYLAAKYQSPPQADSGEAG